VAALSSVLVACDVAAAIDGELLADGAVQAVAHEGAGGVSAYILDLGDGTVALVDTGPDADAASLLAALEARELAPADVAAILLTHGHGDHIAGVPLFDDARVFASPDEVELIAGREHPERPLPSFGDPEETDIEITDALEDGDVLSLGQRQVRAFAVPGHTDGSVAYLFERVLFLGDAATATSQGTLDNAVWIFSKDTEQNLESLRALTAHLDEADLPVDAIACSHSAALQSGLAPLRELTEAE
jgi:glyoxylase-like metal-dependent hydrolase (beta-lactamase superfamily II)